MDNRTYEALKNVIKIARKYALKVNIRKVKDYDEKWDLAVFYRDVVELEGWVDETAKEHETN